MSYRGIGIVALVIFVLVTGSIATLPQVHAVNVTRWQWCKNVSSAGACISPVADKVFAVTDASAYVLAQATEVSFTSYYQFATQWRDPSGDLCNECTIVGDAFYPNLNSFPVWFYLQISGRLPASRPGIWSVDFQVSVNGGGYFSLFTDTFQIGSNAPPPTPTFTVTVDATSQVTPISVDGQSSPAGTRFNWKQGEQHSLSVKKVVPGDKAGVQYVFTGWSDGVSDPSRQITVTTNLVLTAEYKTQYQLTVVSDHGSATGGDWYDDGAKAYVVLDTGSISDGPFYNYVFAGWTDDAQGTNLKSNPITMNSPKTATANWNHEFSTTFYAVIAAVIAIAAVAGFMLMRRSKAPKIPGQAQMATPDTKLSGEKKYCANCRAVLPVEAKVCSTCGQPT